MDRDVVIRAEGLGKKYLIGHQAQRESYVALRDVIARSVRTFGRSVADMARGRPNVAGDDLEEFWALKSLDFEIRHGEVVGIIGRNGAGKSTLLKVLSRITEPTEGRASIRGRVASLLEVGTGFHPELTGRENIYLNGAILGMTHAEIRRKFDEIVAFAEVEKFLDTPVKRYSSGMYVRLAFAVAAHLEPEILIVDEVLAVGDAEFQKKCLGKMGEVAGQGRTVLFVSHNMAAVQTLCRRGLVLSAGSVAFDGPVDGAITAYVGDAAKPARRSSGIRVEPGLTLDGVCISEPTLETGAPLTLYIDFGATGRGSIFECAILICTPRGDRVAVLDVRESGKIPYAYDRQAFTLSAEIASLPLVEGVYTVGLALRTTEAWDDFLDLAEVQVVSRTSWDFVPIAPEWRGVVELSTRLEIRTRQCAS